MTRHPYLLAASTVALLGVAATFVGGTNSASKASATSAAPTHDAEIFGPAIGLPSIPHCQLTSFDVNQFQALAPTTEHPPTKSAGTFHVLSICDDGAISVSRLGAP